MSSATFCVTLAHLHNLSERQIHEDKIVPTSLQDGETLTEIKDGKHIIWCLSQSKCSKIRAIIMIKIFNIFVFYLNFQKEDRHFQDKIISTGNMSRANLGGDVPTSLYHWKEEAWYLRANGLSTHGEK